MANGDTWSKFNEIVQNMLALGIVGTYLYLTIVGIAAPLPLVGFVAAVLIFFGFKALKNGHSNGT